MLFIGIFCFAAVTFGNTSTQLPSKLDLLTSTTIEAYENLPDQEALKQWISAFDQNLVADLAGSQWYISDIPAMLTAEDLWLNLHAGGLIKDLVVVTADLTSGTAKVYFESDVFGDAPVSQFSYWLNLNQGTAQTPTKLFVSREFRDKTFLLRNLDLMTSSKKANFLSTLEIFTAAIFGALFALMAYNFALGIQLRSSLHSLYAAYCLCGMFLCAGNIGLGYIESWHDSMAISPSTVNHFIIFAWATMTVIFTIYFLEPHYRGGILVKGQSLCLLAFLVVAIVGWFIGGSFFLISAINVIALFLVIQFFAMLVHSWHQGSANAIYLLPAFMPVIILSILRATTDQHGIILTNGFQISMVFEMLILSWGLTVRVRRIHDSAKQAKDNAERRERETILHLNKDLERQVADRTKALEGKFIELEKSKNELQKAFEEITTLKGILPICSYCKHIRDDEGSWEQMESYISSHSDTQFSHGICPDCLKKARADSGLDNE